MVWTDNAKIVVEEDVAVDPFKDDRAAMKLEKGEVPAMIQMVPGMPITTLELPALIDAKKLHNFVHTLLTCTGVVIIKTLGQTFWDKDLYLLMQDVWAEITEIIESRPMFIISVATGDIRSIMMSVPALSTISLASPEATFGFPEIRVGGIPSIQNYMMRKRIHEDDIRKMLVNGEAFNAYEAQRIGLVDFVGDVDAEVARLIYKNCQGSAMYTMFKPDVDQALEDDKK